MFAVDGFFSNFTITADTRKENYGSVGREYGYKNNQI